MHFSLTVVISEWAWKHVSTLVIVYPIFITVVVLWVLELRIYEFIRIILECCKSCGHLGN